MLRVTMPLSGAPLPTLPEIQQQMVVERKKGILEFSLVPIVERNGKKQFLVSFMIALTSKPRDARQVRAHHAASAENTQLYAAHSVLSSGRWAKFVCLLMASTILLLMSCAVLASLI